MSVQIRVDDDGRVRLPDVVRHVTGIRPGDLVELSYDSSGGITVSPVGASAFRLGVAKLVTQMVDVESTAREMGRQFPEREGEMSDVARELDSLAMRVLNARDVSDNDKKKEN